MKTSPMVAAQVTPEIGLGGRRQRRKIVGASSITTGFTMSSDKSLSRMIALGGFFKNNYNHKNCRAMITRRNAKVDSEVMDKKPNSAKNKESSCESNAGTGAWP